MCAVARPGFAGSDTGSDLVATERQGGHCAIQCECYAPGRRISKAQLSSFVSATAREPFTACIIVDTGDEWASNAVKSLKDLQPPCRLALVRLVAVAEQILGDRILPLKYITVDFRIPEEENRYGDET